MAIRYYEQEVKAGLKDKRKLTAFLRKLIRIKMPQIKEINLDFIFCRDEYLLEINRQYLNHDTLTDIITFDLSEQEERLSGEIYISTDRVRENAKLFNVSYPEELHRVIFHGALHLCGFKDKTKQQEEIMRQEENKCLHQYFEKDKEL